MTNHIKVGTYTSLATFCLAQKTHLEHIRKMKNRKFYKAKKQATNLVRKVKLMYEKELKKGVIYLRHDEYDVDNKTKLYVYFDVRYVDPNMRYDEKIDSWFYYSTPGLFRNATKVRFVDSINRWMPEQPHRHITIL